MAAFELQQVSRQVCSEGGVLPLLQNVSTRFESAELHALVGPSGGGKTSLLRLLNRLDVPDSGSISFAGRNLADWEPSHLRRTVGLVCQQPHIFPGTTRDNLLYGLQFQTGTATKIDDERIGALCQLCQLPEELLHRPAQRLSVGQQQRLALGRALCLKPQALLLDEPSSALDRPTAESLGQALRELSQAGMTIVLVSHDLHWVRAYADKVSFIADGDIGLQASTEDFFRNNADPHIGSFISGDALRAEGGHE